MKNKIRIEKEFIDLKMTKNLHNRLISQCDSQYVPSKYLDIFI
jgi:hypothetical protein